MRAHSSRLPAGGVWGVATRVHCHQRGLLVGGGCALLHTHTLHRHAAQLPQSALPVHAPLHHLTAASAPSSSTAGAHPVQAVGATVPLSAAHMG